MQELERIALVGLIYNLEKFNPDISKEILPKIGYNLLGKEELKELIKIAEYFSSLEKEASTENKINYLCSIFETVSFKQELGQNFQRQNYYKLKPLSLEEDTIFPVFIKESKDLEKILGSYMELRQEFYKDLQKIENLKENQRFTFIYYLLQKYLWCVPAFAVDVSLFDYSRILSAISCIIYDYQIQTKNGSDFRNIEEKEFLLLLEGDITGIQKFIYNIGKTQGIDNFSLSKALRGRSFLVSLIPEIISRYILKSVGYTTANLIYCGGGKFQILLANTDKNIGKVKNIEQQLEEFFYHNFGCEIGIVLSYTPFSGEYLTGRNGKVYSQVIEKNQIKLDEKKKQKFSKLLNIDFKDSENLCPSCKTIPIIENDTICHLCKKSNDIGDKLPKIKYVAFDIEKKKYLNTVNIDLGNFGKVYLVKEEEIDKFSDLEEILILNSTIFNQNNGFKFLGNTVPLIDESNVEFFRKLGKDDGKAESINPGQVIEFKYLAQLSKGDKKLGIFRADVDNLGLIFSDGLKIKVERNLDKYTISRVATLSRMLDLFFSGYINTLVKEISKDFSMEDLKGVNSLVYIVYSGGDDLFTIAPYDKAIEFSQNIREKFYYYTCKNLDFGISGGIFITSPTMPIHLSASYSENLESKSKKVYYKKDNQIFFKDSVSIFEKTYRWKNFTGRSSLQSLCGKQSKEMFSNVGLSQESNLVFFDSINEVVDRIVSIYEDKSLKDNFSKSFLYKLLSYYGSYVQDGKYIKAAIYPKIYYQIARNFKEKKQTRAFFEELLLKEGYKKDGEIVITKENIIRNLDVIISLVLMKTRGGEKDE